MGNPFEAPATPEKRKVVLTRDEWRILVDGGPNEPGYKEFLDLAAAKGIKYNEGDIDVEVDGKKFTVTTSENDFFTTIGDPYRDSEK